MPEGEKNVTYHGSWVGDVSEEWKKLPLWGKGAAITVAVVVAYVVYRSRGRTAQQASSSTAGSPTAGTQSPFPMVGNLPVLPPGTNPIFDSSGNPIAYQGSPPTGPTSPTTPTAPTAPAQAGLLPYAQYLGLVKPGSKPGYASTVTVNGVTYSTAGGKQGRIWGAPGQMTWQQALNAQNKTLLTTAPQTGGGYDMPSLMNQPNIYTQSAVPHISSAHGG